MPRLQEDPWDDPRDDEDDDEDEGPGEHDGALFDEEDDGEHDLVPCPRCGKMILAEADRCHRCGEYFGREAWLVQPSRGRAVWVVAVVLVVAAMLWFVLGHLW